MAILSDSGWQVTAAGRCYVQRERTVQFEPSTPAEEIQVFVATYNAEAALRPFGQVDYMGAVQDGVGLTVKGLQTCDSGD